MCKNSIDTQISNPGDTMTWKAIFVLTKPKIALNLFIFGVKRKQFGNTLSKIKKLLDQLSGLHLKIQTK
jgi:hypothetical protein